MGIDSVNGAWYAFWSGFGADLPEFGLIVVLWHKFNCHEQGCWRIGLHHRDGAVLCKRHHQASQ